MTVYSWIKPMTWEQAYKFITDSSGFEVRDKFKLNDLDNHAMLIAWSVGKVMFKKFWDAKKYKYRL
jgi:hypothetical protein